MSVHEVRLEPLDPMLFGDSRSARAGLDHLVRDQDPSPLTLHGALGQWLLDSLGGGWSDPAKKLLGDRQPDVLQVAASKEGRPRMAELLGYAYQDGQKRLWFPRPQPFPLLRSRTDEQLLAGLRGRYLAPSLARREDDGATGYTLVAKSCSTELLLSEPDEREASDLLLVERQLLRGWLLDSHPGHDQPLTHNQALASGDLVRRDDRAGIAIRNLARTVAPGILFTRPYRTFEPPNDGRSAGAGIVCWLQTPGELPEELEPIGFLGGDRRRFRVDVTPCDDRPLAEDCEDVARRAEKLDGETSGLALYLLTPAIACEGLPTPFGQEPVASAVGRATWASGWDNYRRSPRPLMSLLPAGSVFFYRWPANVSRGDAVRQLWLQPVFKYGGAVGFGRALVGLWASAAFTHSTFIPKEPAS